MVLPDTPVALEEIGGVEEPGTQDAAAAVHAKEEAGQSVDAASGGVGDDNDDSCSTPRQPHEDLGEVKARTMYRMVEDLHIGNQAVKLLFLTNKQATLLSEVPGSVERITDALEIKAPKLVIRLLQSLGSIGWCRAVQADDFDISEGWHPEWFTLPWTSNPEGHEAERRVERFMCEVILPLAVETNALILCEALCNTCMLTDAFCNAMSLCKSKWAQSRLPFTLIGFTCELAGLYHNHDLTAFWRVLRRKSRTWRDRDPEVRKAVAVNQETAEHCLDLNPHISHFVIGDGMDERRGVLGEYEPFAMFNAHMAMHLTRRLPGICLKTGMGSCIKGDGSSCHVAGEALEGGIPLVLLDLRERSHQAKSASGIPTRQSLIDIAWNGYLQTCDALVAGDSRDSMDMMALAYFYEALYGDGNPLRTHVQDLSFNAHPRVPLFQAIDRNKGNPNASQSGFAKVPPASAEQVLALCASFARRLYGDAEARLLEKDSRAVEDLRAVANGDLFYLGGTIHEYLRQITHLLMHDRLHAANVMDIHGAKQLVGQLARLDRIPSHDVLEGLLLLREAWDEYDVAMYLASRYKWISKLLYLLALVVGICMVLFSVLREEAKVEQLCRLGEETEFEIGAISCNDWGHLGASPKALSYVLFGLALAAGGLCSLSALLNPSERWRQLRGSACSLQSTIWLYRARVGVFATSPVSRLAAQNAFSVILQRWREELVAGTDLQSSSMGQKYKPHVFKHMQRSSNPAQQGSDDFHSPVRPQQYISLRLEPAMIFFQRRIPRSANVRFVMQFLLILCSIAGAVFTQIQGRWPSYVALVSSVGGAMTSWLEFVDLGRKVERYTTTQRHLKNLLSWWATLDGVAQAHLVNIEHLVVSGENILCTEFQAWASTGAGLSVSSNTHDRSDNVEEEAAGTGGIFTRVSGKQSSRRVQPVG